MGDHVGIPGAVLPFPVLLKVTHPTNQLFHTQIYRPLHQETFWSECSFGKSFSKAFISNIFGCLNPKIDEVTANWRKLPLNHISWCRAVQCNCWFIEMIFCMHAINHSWVDQSCSCLSLSCFLCVHKIGCKVGGIIFRKNFARLADIVAGWGLSRKFHWFNTWMVLCFEYDDDC